jgi:predicted metal-dependent hydrolase
VRKPVIMLDHEQLHINVHSEDQAYLRLHLTAWYHDRAAERVGERIIYYAHQMGVSPRAVRIKDQKKRWGSCTSGGNLYINWRCILAPAPILDYIVVHELCHLLVMNHSAHFWVRVRSILPDFEARRKWLRVNGITLDFK